VSPCITWRREAYSKLLKRLEVIEKAW